MGLEFHPATPERWKDLETLFGDRGACGGCWCMYWRIPRAEYERKKGEDNRRALKKIVDSKTSPGILAYDGTTPVGWCSFGPRESYSVLSRSRILSPVDNEPVWSIVCFFVTKKYRRKGLTVGLLKSAAKYAKENGAKIVEGYPVEPHSGTFPEAFAFTGLSSAFKKAGFHEVARRSETRPIMRMNLSQRPKAR
jgi:GNAT superfamily N-acetyltransferase